MPESQTESQSPLPDEVPEGWSPAPDYGDVMDIVEFVGYCRALLFTNDDGHGRYYDPEKKLTKDEPILYPFEVAEGKWDRKATYVIWFNK